MMELTTEIQVSKVTAPVIGTYHTTDTVKKRPETVGKQPPFKHPDQSKSLSWSFTDHGLFGTNYCNKCPI
jgi:heat shock protein HslJ